MVNADLITNIKDSFISGNDNTFWPAVTKYIQSLPIEENPKKALKNLYYNGQLLINYAVLQRQFSDNQRFVYSRYFTALGDELIEASNDQDYLLKASALHNDEMIKILYSTYLELLSYAPEDKKSLIQQRLETVERAHEHLTAYFKNEKESFIKPPPLIPMPVENTSPLTPTTSLTSSNTGLTESPLQHKSGINSEHSPSNQPVVTRNNPPTLPNPSTFPPPLIATPLASGGFVVSFAAKNSPDDQPIEKSEAYRLDPLTFRRTTWYGAGVGLFLALSFLCVAYTMEDDTLREGFTRMFRHMSDDFHHTHGDTSMHTNVKLSARVCFFGVLSLGTAAVGGLIGSRVNKPGA